MGILRIISGAQTGADRAAIDVAIDYGIEYSGWVPKGRLAEDGIISDRYCNLLESDSESPDVRTKLNVCDSNATLIISHGPLSGGSKYTEEVAEELGVDCKHLDLDRLTIDEAVEQLRSWLKPKGRVVLNVAGPRSSSDPNIYADTKEIISRVLEANRQSRSKVKANGTG